jgi:hypothetical protein
LVGSRREAFRADTRGGFITILEREWVLREIADRRVTLPAERVITGLAIAAVVTSVRA